MSDLDEFRKAKDASFRDGDDSPFTPPQRRSFAGLAYFAPNEALNFVLQPEVFADPDTVDIDLSAGDDAQYARWAKIDFEVDGQPAALSVFHDLDSGDLFLPFKDATATDGETYGAGRYVDVHSLADGSLLVDFNYAFNPYCAYNEQWTCPLTPPEKQLRVRITAGEKAFVSITPDPGRIGRPHQT